MDTDRTYKMPRKWCYEWDATMEMLRDQAGLRNYCGKNGTKPSSLSTVVK